MAGIYVHIPFCASRCIYCDFYSTTRLDLRQRYVDALCREMSMRSDYLIDRVNTIYIGGGTPSQLSPTQLRQLFSSLVHCFSSVMPDITQIDEVTIECNPDDVTADYAQTLASLPINRVSMGVQTFNDERLGFLRRRHCARQAETAVRLLREAGIGNISIDLMYGFPDETIEEWHRDIDRALALNVEHISAYSLMYEEGTQLTLLLQQGQVKEVDEELSLQMYSALIDRLTTAGFEHYEISNFARRIPSSQISARHPVACRSAMTGDACQGKKARIINSHRSLHNSSYWNQTPYIGLGAAAHSFNVVSRQWNPDDIDAYLKGIEAGSPVVETETLNDSMRYNDIVLTALRTCEGIDLNRLPTGQKSYCLQQAHQFLSDGLLQQNGDHIILTRRGLFVSNMIMSELMIV